MAEYNNVGKGSLKRATDKRSESSPDYKGSITLDRDLPRGSRIWIAGWAKQSEEGPWMSLAGSISDAPRAAAPRPATQYGSAPRHANPLDDEIPFAAEFR